jgi:hypothetical protein
VSSIPVSLELKDLPWTGTSRYEVGVINDQYDLQAVSTSRMPMDNIGAHSVVLLTVQPSRWAAQRNDARVKRRV